MGCVTPAPPPSQGQWRYVIDFYPSIKKKSYVYDPFSLSLRAVLLFGQCSYAPRASSCCFVIHACVCVCACVRAARLNEIYSKYLHSRSYRKFGKILSDINQIYRIYIYISTKGKNFAKKMINLIQTNVDLNSNQNVKIKIVP